MHFKSIMPIFLLGLTSVGTLNDEPFKYRYQIVANSNSASDLLKVYEYKEKIIDLYEQKYLDKTQEEIGKALINDIDLFKVAENTRPYYAEGIIVLMVGKANGMCIEGSLRRDSCDETVIRTKIFIFDLFDK